MIVVDTSALVAILQGEAESALCQDALRSADRLLISAGTMTEALIVSADGDYGAEMAVMLDRYGFEVAVLTAARARRAGAAYTRWGKGFHPTRLNFGDCFAYALAQEHRCPLLYIGEDFAQTDVVSAL